MNLSLKEKQNVIYLSNYIAIRLDKFYFVHCAKVLFRLRQKKALLRLLSLAPTTNSMMMRRRTRRATGDTDDNVPRARETYEACHVTISQRVSCDHFSGRMHTQIHYSTHSSAHLDWLHVCGL